MIIIYIYNIHSERYLAEKKLQIPINKLTTMSTIKYPIGCKIGVKTGRGNKYLRPLAETVGDNPSFGEKTLSRRISRYARRQYE